MTDFDGAVDAQRDVDYAAVVQTLTIEAGETTGTTTMTVTPVNNNDEDEPRAFTVNARVGNEALLSTGILITDDDTTSEIDHAISESDRDKRGRGGDHSYGDRHLAWEGVPRQHSRALDH